MTLIFNTDSWFRLLHEECFAQHPLLIQATKHGAYYLVPNKRLGAIKKWASLTNFYSQRYAPVNGVDSIHMSLCELAKAEGIVLIELDYVLRESEIYEHLVQDFAQHGFACQVQLRYGNWILPTRGTRYEDYFDGLHSRLRNTIARAEKKLNKQGDVRFRVYTENNADLSGHIAQYQRVYASSWKTGEMSESFVRHLIGLSAQRGELCLGMLELNGRVVASQFWIVSDQTAFIYKLAYDPEYRKFSVGTLLTHYLIRHVFELVDIVDYGIGDEPYKKDWMTHKQHYVRMCAVNRQTLTGQTIAVYQRWRSLAKSVAKRLISSGVRVT